MAKNGNDLSPRKTKTEIRLKRKIRWEVERYLYGGRGKCVLSHEAQELTECIMGHISKAVSK